MASASSCGSAIPPLPGLNRGAKSFVSNRGYRKFIKASGERFEIDDDKVKREARYDGKWVLKTNTTMPPESVALHYMQLLMVEQLFATTKSVLRSASGR